MSQRESSVSFPALGSIAVVAVADGAALAHARAAVQRTVDEFDLACSRFRDDSELCALNRAAGSSNMRVGALLMEATLAALRAAQLTDGDVDPTVGRALVALGYDRDFDALGAAPRDRTISIVPAPGWRAVRVDEAAGTIRLPRGVALDLGATAKALAADRAAAHACAAAGCGVLVGLGGDIAIAGPAPAGGWRVRVTDDHRAGTQAPGQWIALRSGGLATSSITTRRWQAGARSLHHLIEPATGAPVRAVWRTASVTAASCLDANIASTASIIRGRQAAAWLESLRLPSRLVTAGGTVRHLAGWPADGDDLADEELHAVA
jgi:thiamine biosynthesis lipoprotein